ncbi:MAG TPA: cytochrome c biogenesis protein CcsA [Gemmatimonadaceae bacterium]|nr:cytochrome c biogenesis protein CcsA [Gemmatimonadaceae bacterium]
MGTTTREPSAPTLGARPAGSRPPAPSARLARFGLAAFLIFGATQAWAVLNSAPDRAMGHLQKIMYLHVPTAWAGMLAFAIVFLASILYLWRREDRWDHLALASAEVGTLLIAITLALGSIWGKPTWGIWWTWDPRLTTTAILLLMYAGYLALRAFVEDHERAARWSAVVGILAFVNVPIVYMSVRWWRTLHQVQSGPRTMDRNYLIGLAINSISILFVMGYLIARRAEAARLERAAEAAHEDRALSGAVRGRV